MVETKHQPQELLDEVERGVNLHNIKEENVKKSFVGAFSISEKSYHTINDLLEKNTSRFHIQMNDLFANHLSHGLVALFKLGASSDRLNQYYKNYTSATSSKPLEPARPVDPSVDINEGNWEQFIGKQQYFPNLKQFFKQQLEMIEDEEEDRGHRTRILVKKYFPKLAKGLIGDAFHGMIQLGYGLEIMNETTVIEGLAFLAYVNLPLGEISTNPHHSITESIIDITGAVRSDPNTQKLLKTMQEREMNFTDRVELVAKNQELLREFDIKIMADRDPIEVLDRIWKGCIQAYLSSDNDFFVLHCVTGCRCMQTIVPLLAPDDRVRAVQYFWKAVVAAYICRNAPELDQSKWVIHKASSLPTWDKIIAKALKPPQDTSKENTHSIKLVFCCLENDRDLGYDPLHRLAAARRVELVPWPPL